MSVLGLGFAQGLYALDAADGETEHVSAVSPTHACHSKMHHTDFPVIVKVVNVLVQALLQCVLFVELFEVN